MGRGGRGAAGEREECRTNRAKQFLGEGLGGKVKRGMAKGTGSRGAGYNKTTRAVGPRRKKNPINNPVEELWRCCSPGVRTGCALPALPDPRNFSRGIISFPPPPVRLAISRDHPCPRNLPPGGRAARRLVVSRVGKPFPDERQLTCFPSFPGQLPGKLPVARRSRSSFSAISRGERRSPPPPSRRVVSSARTPPPDAAIPAFPVHARPENFSGDAR